MHKSGMKTLCKVFTCRHFYKVEAIIKFQNAVQSLGWKQQEKTAHLMDRMQHQGKSCSTEIAHRINSLPCIKPGMNASQNSISARRSHTLRQASLEFFLLSYLGCYPFTSTL